MGHINNTANVTKVMLHYLQVFYASCTVIGHFIFRLVVLSYWLPTAHFLFSLWWTVSSHLLAFILLCL